MKESFGFKFNIVKGLLFIVANFIVFSLGNTFLFAQIDRDNVKQWQVDHSISMNGGGLPPGGGGGRPPRLRVKELKPEVRAFKDGAAPGIEQYESLGYCTGNLQYGFNQIHKQNYNIREYHLLVTSEPHKAEGYDHDHRDEDYLRIVLANESGEEFKNKRGENPCGNLSHVETGTSLSMRGRAINAPPLFFNEGERAKIVVHNKAKKAMTIHWHGLFLETKMDGIPGFQLPVMPNTKFTYEFDLNQNGTYWYHPHDLNEQDTKGAIIIFSAPIGKPIKKPNGKPYLSPGEWITYQSSQSKYNTSYNHDRMIMMTDYKDRSPLKTLSLLQNNQQTYTFDSGYSRGFYEQPECFEEFRQNFKTMKMFWMDPADVWYDFFLLNDETCLSCGPWAQQLEPLRKESPNQSFPLLREFANFTEGDRIRLRLINSSASTYFHVNYGNSETITDPKQKLDMLVVAKDGQAVEPVYFDSLYMGMGETYDVIIDIPNSKTLYELNIKSIDDYDPKKNNEGTIIRETRRIARVLIGDGRGSTTPNRFYYGGNRNDKESLHDSNAPIKIVKAYDQSITLCGPKREDPDTHSEADVIQLKRRTPPINSQLNNNRPIIDPIALPPFNEKDSVFQALRLAGNMEDYYWQILPDNKSKTKSELKNKLKIKTVDFKYFQMSEHKDVPYIELASEKYNFIQIKNTMMDGMMNHPWHMHGLYFKMLSPEDLLLDEVALNKLIQEKPLLHTANIKPGETRVIAFYAANEFRGAWMFHCHNLFHMASDMMMFVKYDNFNFNELGLPLKYGGKNNKDVIGIDGAALEEHHSMHSYNNRQTSEIQDFLLELSGMSGGFITGGASSQVGVDLKTGGAQTSNDVNVKTRLNCKKGGHCFAEIVTGVTKQDLSEKDLSVYANGRVCSGKYCVTISYNFEMGGTGPKSISHTGLAGVSYRVFNSETLVLNAAAGAVCRSDPNQPNSKYANGCLPAGDINITGQITNGKIGAFNQPIPQSKVVYRGLLTLGCKEDEEKNNGNICNNIYAKIGAEALINRNVKLVGFCRVSTGSSDSHCLFGLSLQLDPIYHIGESH